MNLTREITFRAAYDKRHPEPSKNYGVHGVDMIWELKGKDGAYRFIVYTNWHLPHVRKKRMASHLLDPVPADVCYHSSYPQYEGHEVSSESCEVIGGPCYFDGSPSMADELFDLLVREGSEAVWLKLEEMYKEKFKE